MQGELPKWSRPLLHDAGLALTSHTVCTTPSLSFLTSTRISYQSVVRCRLIYSDVQRPFVFSDISNTRNCNDVEKNSEEQRIHKNSKRGQNENFKQFATVQKNSKGLKVIHKCSKELEGGRTRWELVIVWCFFLDLSQFVSFIQSVRFSFSVMATYPTSLLGGIVWFFVLWF